MWKIIQDHNLEIFHIDFEPASKLRNVLLSPVTEVATFFFDDTPPTDYLDGAATFAEHCVNETDSGFIDLVAGVTYDTVERGSVRGKAAMVLIGWRSVEDHTKFLATQAYKDHFHLLNRDAKKNEVHHVAYRDIQEFLS